MSKPVPYAALNIRIQSDTKKRLEAYAAAKGQSGQYCGGCLA